MSNDGVDDKDKHQDVHGLGQHLPLAPTGSPPKSSLDDADSPVSKKGSGEKKAGRRKINIEFIEDKSRRHITFSKRKAGIMKKAYELSTLTGTQVLLLVASETGHVYTFATPKLQPLITKPEGKNLIQACLNAPDTQAHTPSTQAMSHAPAQRLVQPASAPQYQEPPMMYPGETGEVYEDKKPLHHDDRQRMKPENKGFGIGLDMYSAPSYPPAGMLNNRPSMPPYPMGMATRYNPSHQMPPSQYPQYQPGVPVMGSGQHQPPGMPMMTKHN